jgi:hypothetical protein
VNKANAQRRIELSNLSSLSGLARNQSTVPSLERLGYYHLIAVSDLLVIRDVGQKQIEGL